MQATLRRGQPAGGLERATSDPWYLTSTGFLGNLDEHDRHAFLALGHRHSFARHDFIFRSGDPGRNVYVLEQGRAKIYKESDTGKELILWFCFPGEMFGLAEASRGGCRDVFAQACTNAVVHRIPRERFSQFLRERHDVAVQVIDLLSCRLRVLGDIMTNLATENVSSRIIKLLLRLCSRYGSVSRGCELIDESLERAVCLDIPLTHREIADMLGTSRQTVSAMIGELKKSGVLRMHHRHIHVDPDRLQRLLLE